MKYLYHYTHKHSLFVYLYTPRTLRACCSQSELMILKICESSARALFLYNFPPGNFEHLVQCLHVPERHVRFIPLLHWYQIFLAIFNDILNCKMSYLSHLNKTKSLCRV